MPSLRYETPPTVTVPRDWPGATVVVLATGPSLTVEDVARVRAAGVRTIAINDAYRLAPWADVLYACDAQWWTWHRGAPGFAGTRYALAPEAARWPRVRLLRHTGTDGVETDPGAVRTGRHSGYQAIQVAIHYGAARVILLGYDLGGGPGGEHFFGDHPNGHRTAWRELARYYDGLARELPPGVAVLNASRRTAIAALPRVPLDEALAC